MRKNKDFRSLTDPDRRSCQVGPPEAFSDEIAPEKYRREPYRSTEDQGITANGVFEESASVKAVLGSRCCGWTQEPTSEEFYDAVRSPEPTTRQKAIIWTWIDEAPMECFIGAWRDGAYSWRMLARAFCACGNDCYERMRILNTFAARPELIEPDWFPWQQRRPTIPEATIYLEPDEKDE